VTAPDAAARGAASPGSAPSPQLAAIVADFARAQARLHRLADALPEERWAARPGPDRWSAAECVAHLNLTSRAYVPLVRAALAAGGELPADAAARDGVRRYRRDPIGWLISTISGPLPSLGRLRLGRVRTVASFVPGGALPRAELVAEFDALQAEQTSLTREADGLPLDRIQVVSPFDARVRYNLYAALVTLPRHQHRHLGQAEAAVGGR